MVRFLVEKVQDGIKVMIKGKADSGEVIPFKALKASVSREVYAYTERHIGPRAEIGNKGGYGEPDQGCDGLTGLTSP